MIPPSPHFLSFIYSKVRVAIFFFPFFFSDVISFFAIWPVLLIRDILLAVLSFPVFPDESRNVAKFPPPPPGGVKDPITVFFSAPLLWAPVTRDARLVIASYYKY